MPGPDPEDQGATVYAVRLAARRGPEAADRWRDGMLDTIESLATLPGRCAVAREDRLFAGATVRKTLHARRRRLFTVHEADADDPPRVWVRHVRHGAEAPLTQWPSEDDDA